MTIYVKQLLQYVAFSFCASILQCTQKFLSRSIPIWSGRKAIEAGTVVNQWGYGIEYSQDGGHVIYTGQWQDGLHHGFGTEYKDTPRVYYKGQWKAGQRHGKGRDVLDGEANYYEGHFVNGLRHGHGILKLANRNYTYDGGMGRR